MNLAKIRGILTCLLIALASTTNAQVARYLEGVHYKRLPEPMDSRAEQGQATVLEIFWYGCNSCYAFDPLLNAWVAEKAGAIAFARSPMIWDANTKQHARLFYTSQALGLHEQMHARIFDEIHARGNYLLDAAAMAELFTGFGIDTDTFAKTMQSFGVDANVRKAETQQREMFIPSVPALVVDGVYLINVTPQVQTHEAMLDVADFLLNKTP